MTVRYDQLCEQVTARIVQQIETGTAGTWRAPWHHNGTADLFCPTNATTLRPYAGANVLILAFEALDADYSDNRWSTYRQWQSMGAQVRRGEHGTRCVKWIAKTPSADQPPDGENTARVLIPRVFTVFNADQVDLPDEPTDTTEPALVRTESAEAFITATGAQIDYGFNTAKYRPLVDRIQVPAIGQYRQAEDHYATILHELVHWTGHQSRLSRTFGERFGDDAYAVEELVAELGAAFATARLGITNSPRSDHAAYLAHWLRILDQNPKVLFQTASSAQTAVDHLATYSRPTTQSEVAA
ncbi:MAG: zincin-like metallopeptidase domain-containing protein [Acidimicrobiales bacterium]